MRKNLLTLLLLILCVSFLKADPGDTIKIKSHDEVHMNWNGNYDRKAKFPDASKKFNKILMHYTLGCPTKGCSEWDYTTQIFLRQPTGRLDSNIRTTPNFRVDGSAQAQLRYNTFVTYSYFFNSTTKAVDSTANDTLELKIFGDSLKPLVATQTINVWRGDYYRYTYDTLGNKTDSTYIGYETELNRKNWEYYNVFEVVNNLELGRVITPYNGNVPPSWKYTYSFDVTEFASLLHDSVDIRARYGGWQDGFTVTLDFEFIEGTPARECYQIVPLWQGSHAYGNTNNPIENFLEPRSVVIDGQMKQAVLRVIQTGHGFGGADGCSEFCQKKHFIKVHGQTYYTTTVWRDKCGENPIYPQGGTWVYNRSNWCPGEEVYPYDYDLTQPLSQVNATALIDMDMEPYVNQGNNNSSYIISGMLFLYKDNNYKDEASLEEILTPNNAMRYNRINPSCSYPIVKVKNNGGENIKTIEFSYGPKDGTKVTYTWSGDIKPYESAELELAKAINFSSAAKVFEVEIVKVNGKTDEVPYNNKMAVAYDATPTYPNDFIIWLRTNNRGNENAYTIKDAWGKVVAERSGMLNGTLYTDTVRLDNGCFTFEITDTRGDGLGFWANPNAGTGQLFFRRLGNGQVLRNFGTDWGSSIKQKFTTAFALDVEETTATNSIEVFPNPSKGEFWLDINMSNSKNATVEVFDYSGRKIIAEHISSDNFYAYRIDMSTFSNGVYILKVTADNGKVFTNKMVKTQ